MKPEIKQKWIRALKSGKYKQGRSQLREGNNYCCLGVLCDIYRKEKRLKWDKNKEILNPNSASPDHKIEAWADSQKDCLDNFWSLNDVERLTFEEIAVYIENGL